MSTATARNVSVKLDDDIRERIQHVADAHQRSAHWVMRQAIELYVEREETREAVRQAALQAWQRYREDGLHVTGGETDAWLAKLSQGQDAEPPDCHA